MSDAVLEMKLDHVKDMLVGLSRRTGRSGSPPVDTLFKSLTVLFLSHGKHQDGDMMQIARQRFPKEAEKIIDLMRDPGEWVRRAVTSPAQTTVPSWAAEFIGVSQYNGVLSMIAPRSVYSQLSLRPSAVRISFEGVGTVKIPQRNPSPNIAGIFCGEGAQIPVKKMNFGSTTLLPYSAKVISIFSNEIRRRSTPQIENIIRVGMVEDTTAALDGLLLSDTAGTALFPSGIYAGVVPIPATAGGGANAVAKDFGALAEAIPQAADLVFLANESDRLRAFALLPGLSAFNFITAPALPPKTILALDVGDFASAEGDNPQFDIQTESLVVNSDSQPVEDIGNASTLSLWQMDIAGLRGIFDVSWAMRRSGRVSVVESVTW